MLNRHLKLKNVTMVFAPNGCRLGCEIPEIGDITPFVSNIVLSPLEGGGMAFLLVPPFKCDGTTELSSFFASENSILTTSNPDAEAPRLNALARRLSLAVRNISSNRLISDGETSLSTTVINL